MIKSIIFDWGGVLIERPTPGLIKYFSKYFKVTEERFTMAHTKYIDPFQRGKLEEKIYWKKICLKLSVDKPTEEYLWTKAFKKVYIEKKEVFTLASTLQNNRYKTCMLSNTEIPLMNFFYEQGYHMFDEQVFSCKEGFRKPDKKIYEITLDRLDTDPDETLLIDDREENIAGAKKLGIHAVLFKNINDLIEDLYSFSINLSQ